MYRFFADNHFLAKYPPDLLSNWKWNFSNECWQDFLKIVAGEILRKVLPDLLIEDVGGSDHSLVLLSAK